MSTKLDTIDRCVLLKKHVIILGLKAGKLKKKLMKEQKGDQLC